MLTYDFVRGSKANGLYLEMPDVKLVCFVDGSSTIYKQNITSLPKGTKLKFELMRSNGAHFIKSNTDKIEWQVINTGQEASKAGNLTHNLAGQFNGCIAAETDAAYLGHHLIECKVIRQHGDNIIAKHYIFAQ